MPCDILSGHWSPIIGFRLRSAVLVTTLLIAGSAATMGRSSAQYLDDGDKGDWPGYGRTFGEQHYSPLEDINESSVNRLGMVWSLDLGPENSATQPIAVDGVLYFATGLSVVHAVDAGTGKLLWRYDPKSAINSGRNLRFGWGTRGIAWWKGKIYTGTNDGRLIAIDARTGTELWRVQTFPRDDTDVAHINGAPRVFDGKVVIGWAGDTEQRRGYVTAYDAETGRKLWRFFTVPGNPAKGFEDKAMQTAAGSWAGQWWKHGGGGHVWNAIAYDPETDTIFLGTGNAFPWNRRFRSQDEGDNLFASSIVAIRARDGSYKWHYQTTPGDTWDYDAIEDIELADLLIGGKARKVLIQAPKNGFFYVIDRRTGELISARAYAKTTWASEIDKKTGRPMEVRGARYPHGSSAYVWPSGIGAHSWMPMAYNPKTRLAYIPVIESGMCWSDNSVEWRPSSIVDGGSGGISQCFVNSTSQVEQVSNSTPFTAGLLLAWDPVKQTAAWSVPRPTMYNGGILTTGGNLVFQGTIDGTFRSYSAVNGRLLWSFDAHTPIIGAPISYEVHGEQYVTVLTGLGMGIAADAGADGRDEKYGLDPRSQARRVLTFRLGGTITLPPPTPAAPPIDDPEFIADVGRAEAGASVYSQYCGQCHGPSVVAAIQAPDLRRSPIPLSAETFAAVVRDGSLVSGGMPEFAEFTDDQLATLRQYIRTETKRLRSQLHP